MTFPVVPPDQPRARRRPVRHALLLLILLPALITGTWATARRVEAWEMDAMTLFEMALHHQGDAALQWVIAAAAETGGWAAAPGDVVVFDPYLLRDLRGATLDYDEFAECTSTDLISEDAESCIARMRVLEQQVRFGLSMFMSEAADGSTIPRPAFDDLLSTYIEEVGHSWQEYQYETKGHGDRRIRSTSRAEAERWSFGREYQIKRYILSLDGSVIALSDAQREMLRAHICLSYASPVGHDIPRYGAPEGWPNPQGWPTVAPTPDELEAFCAGL